MRFSRTCSKLLGTCNPELLKQLQNLNQGKSYGRGMYNLSRDHRIIEDKNSQVHYISLNKKVVAWSLIFTEKNDYSFAGPIYFYTYLYVDKKYRRRGLGTKLIKNSMKFFREHHRERNMHFAYAANLNFFLSKKIEKIIDA